MVYCEYRNSVSAVWCIVNIETLSAVWCIVATLETLSAVWCIVNIETLCLLCGVL